MVNTVQERWGVCELRWDRRAPARSRVTHASARCHIIDCRSSAFRVPLAVGRSHSEPFMHRSRFTASAAALVAAALYSVAWTSFARAQEPQQVIALERYRAD